MISDLGKPGLKRFISFWVAAYMFCFIVFAATTIVMTAHLQSMNRSLLDHSRRQETAHRMEILLLLERHEFMAYLTTGDEESAARSNEYLETVGRMILELEKSSWSFPGNLSGSVYSEYKQFVGKRKMNPDADVGEADESFRKLVSLLESYRLKCLSEMKQLSMRQERLDSIVDKTTLLLIVVLSIVTVIGGYELIKRIMHPSMALMQAADKFGNGEFDTRAAVYRNDELGRLAGTFNNMAEGIQEYEEERINFVASIAHDLKNPFVIIGAASRRLRNEHESSGKIEMKWLNAICEQSLHAESLLNDLMDMAQINAGNYTLDIDTFEISQFTSDIVGKYQAHITTHTIEYHSGGDYWVAADPRKLERVVMNLLSNAVKYSPQGTVISVSTAEGDGTVNICVADQGPGIDAAGIEELFRPFKRIEKTAAMASGAGLGLFSSKKIIEAHNGRISVASDPEKGTEFTIMLPHARKMSGVKEQGNLP